MKNGAKKILNVTNGIESLKSQLIPTVTRKNRVDINESTWLRIYNREKILSMAGLLEYAVELEGYKPMFIFKNKH